MTYRDFMQKIILLPGWSWEWKFGDRVWCDIESGFVAQLDGDHRMDVHFEDDIYRSVQKADCIPLPTVEQWMEKLRGNGLIELTYYPSEHYEAECAKTDSLIADKSPCVALAILFARVVLGYKLDGKEFGKC